MSSLPPDAPLPPFEDPFKGSILGGSWDSLHDQAREAYLGGEIALAAAFEEEAARCSDATEVQVASSLMHRARCLDELGRHEEEVQEYGRVLQRFQASEEPEIQVWVAQALVNRGITFAQANQHLQAIEEFRQVCQRWDQAEEEDLRYEVARAFHFQGLSLAALNRHEDAAASYEEAARLAQGEDEAEFLARIRFNQGRSLLALGRVAEALAHLDRLGQMFLEAMDPDQQQAGVRALMAKAFLLFELKRHDEELAIYDRILERFSDDPGYLEVITRISFERAIALGNLGRREDEVAQYASLAQRLANTEDPALHLYAAKALVNQGCTLHAMGLTEEALTVLRPLPDAFSQAPYLLEQAARALGEQAAILDRLEHHEEELLVYDRIIQLLDKADETELTRRLAFAYNDKAITLHELERLDEGLACTQVLLERFGEDPRPELADPCMAALRERAAMLDHQERHEEELATYEALLARYQQRGDGESPGWAQTLWVRALTLRQLDRQTEAQEAFSGLFERFKTAPTEALRAKAPAALFELAVMAKRQNQPERAEALHHQAMDFLEDPSVDVRLEAAKSAVNRVHLLRSLGRKAEAQAAIEAFLQRPDAQDELLEPAIRMACSRASILEEEGRLEEARVIYQDLVDRHSQHPNPEIRAQVLEQHFNLAILLGELGQPEQELAEYSALYAAHGSDKALGTEAQEWIASALLNQACTLHRLEREEEALQVLDQLMSKFGEDGRRADEVSRALRERSSLLEDLGREEEALAACDELIARYRQTEDRELIQRVGRALFDRGDLLETLDRSEEAIEAYAELWQWSEQAERNPELEALAARGLLAQVDVLKELDHSEQAMQSLDRLLQACEGKPWLALQEAHALQAKASLLDEGGETSSAMTLHGQIFARYQDSERAELRALAAGSLFEQALTHAQAEDSEAEAAAYRKLIETFGVAENLSSDAIQAWVAKAQINQALELEIHDEPEAAMALYRAILEANAGREEETVRAQAAKAGGLLGVLLCEQGRRQEAMAVFQQTLDHFRNDDSDEVLSELALSLHGRVHMDILALKADILRGEANLNARIQALETNLDHAVALREDEDDDALWNLERAYLFHLMGEADTAQDLIDEVLEEVDPEDLPDGVWLEAPTLPQDRSFKRLLKP